MARITESELLDELVKIYGVKERQPGDVTAAEMAKATGKGRSWCCTILNQKVLSGELVKEKVMGNSGVVETVFRKAK